MTHQLDYGALREPITKDDIVAFRQSRGNKGSFFGLAGTKVALIAFGLLALWAVYMSVQARSLFPAVSTVLIAGVFVAVYWVWSNHTTKFQARLFKFASRNGLQIIQNVPDPTYPGMIFDDGHGRRIATALRFGDGTEIGNYIYSTGSGKNSRTHNWGYVKVRLVRRLPHMILDARSNNFWKFSNLSDSFDRSQVLSLEGDFDKYFTLYVPKQYERDALYVFTPDVMAAMIDHGKHYDIEIVDDELYIYVNSHFQLNTPETYNRMLAITNAISSELVSQTDYYADERIGDRSVNMVAGGGRRLKSGFNWLMVVVVALVIYFNIIHPLLFR